MGMATFLMGMATFLGLAGPFSAGVGQQPAVAADEVLGAGRRLIIPGSALRPGSAVGVGDALQRRLVLADAVEPYAFQQRSTRVLAEQTAAVDASRLGDMVGSLTFDELRCVDAALRLVLEL